MYSTCIFCQARLGANQSIESFPVGRRLAFDAARGRLWVVCRRCERWNLTPLEERWEAVEECEKRYRDSRQRVATDNVGLARVDDGMELVRIGSPLRPELAAWRYGDQFGRRRRRTIIQTGAAAIAGATLLASGPLVGMATGTVFLMGNLALNAWAVALARKNSLTLPHPEGGRVHLSANQLAEVRLIAAAEQSGGWALDVPYVGRSQEDDPWYRKVQFTNMTTDHVRLTGASAEFAAAKLLARINSGGARAQRVQDATRLLDESGDPARFFAHAASRTREWGRVQMWGDTGSLRFLPHPVRLALEMAAHEDTERLAMEGELAELEAAWRDAEEVAAIADSMLLPEGVERRWREMKGEVGQREVGPMDAPPGDAGPREIADD